jgi:hypothetical protein
MPILQDAGRVTIENSTFRDIAGHVYDFSGQDSSYNLYLVRLHVVNDSIIGLDSIHQLNELSVMEAVYDVSYPPTLPTDTGGCLKMIQSWLVERSVPMLLLSGPQGTGKSRFAQTIAYACVHKARYPVISFCFSSDDLRRSDLNRAIPTLAAQLNQLDELKAPGLKEAIKQSLEADPFMWSRSLGKQFTDLVIQPIHTSLDRGADKNLNYIILLDGIDACRDYAALKQFLSDIKVLIAEEVYYNRIKILCTSRDVPDVTAAFRSIINYCRRIPMQPSAQNNVMKILNDRGLKNPQIIASIADKSAGNVDLAIAMSQRLAEARSAEDVQRLIDDTAARLQPPSASNTSFAQPVRRDTRSSLDPSPLTKTSPLDILLTILRKRKARAEQHTSHPKR